jgi:hypothetical protein
MGTVTKDELSVEAHETAEQGPLERRNPLASGLLPVPLRRHYSNPAVRHAIEQLWLELPANKEKRSGG